jgi:recombinase
MPTERIRQTLSGPLTTEHLQKFQQQGWKPVAVEWEREVPGTEPSESAAVDPPFGLRVANNCLSLESDPLETEVLVTMMELIIQDGPYSFIAQELNRRGYLTRQGSKWSPVSVFEMLPRLIDAGPAIFSTQEWQRRRRTQRERSLA